MLYFLPNASSSPYVATTDWCGGFEPHSESQAFQLELMLNNMEQIFPVISNDTGDGEKVGVNEKTQVYSTLKNK
jgi:hypothetical protein